MPLTIDDPIPAAFAEPFLNALSQCYPAWLIKDADVSTQLATRAPFQNPAAFLPAIWTTLPSRVRQAAIARAFPLPVCPATTAAEKLPEDLSSIPVDALEESSYIPLEVNNRGFFVATPFPWLATTIRSAAARDYGSRNGAPKRVTVTFCSYEAYGRTLQELRVRQAQRGEISNSRVAELAGDAEITPVLDLGDDTQPTNEILRPILQYAVAGAASDVYLSAALDPATERNYLRIQIRFGELEDFKLKTARDGREWTKVLKQRFCTLCRISDRGASASASGKFRLRVRKPGAISDVEMDVRFEALENELGYHTTLRLLDRTRRLPDLNDIFRYAPEAFRLVRRNMKEPDGIFLSCGPTGSGKTTLLNSILEELNTGRYNVMTVEHPVEYRIPGLAQFDVGLLQRSLTEKDNVWLFALKSLLRKDLDIGMIGEIRDHEVAAVAVEFSVTGHQLYASLHANSVCNIGERLNSMGARVVEFAFAMKVGVAQRLVRKVCRQCSDNVIVDGEDHALDWLKRKGLPQEWASLMASGDAQLREARKGKRCPVCNGRGYHGCAVAIEALDFTDPELQELVVSSPQGYPSSYRVMQLAERQRSPLLAVSALRMIFDGATDLAAVEEQIAIHREVARCDKAFETDGTPTWNWTVAQAS